MTTHFHAIAFTETLQHTVFMTNEQAPNCDPTLKDRWNRMGHHMRAGIIILGIVAVVITVKTGINMRDTGGRLPAHLIQKNDCQNNQDCKGPHLICNARRTCEALPNPIGSCTQLQVLTYVGTNGRAKHTFCEDGCAITDKGARCL